MSFYSNKRKNPFVNRKLTYEQAEEIREIYAAGGYSQAKLAERYGIHVSGISAIIARRSYTTNNRTRGF